ncbi:Uncharacterized protein GBIM_09621 [Gryllus bimaculatus]|nr:Uncharacterized protein GBIM_09621 [Gryllus bimaculatus]
MAEIDMAETATADEALHCFVCDVAVTGKHYTLATCRTQSSNIRLIEKLGQLVGERYMVVICEDDIICRGCANLINTLDRLENEMDSVRKVVLRFLEKKYSLEEGELINNKTSAYGLPPQITPRNMSPRSVMSENFMYQKRKAALSELENETNYSVCDKSKKSNSKNDVWMQCDKCKYTTQYDAFMNYHVRQQVKKKKVDQTCESCGTEMVNGCCAQNCNMRKDPSSFTSTSSVLKTDLPKQTSKMNSGNDTNNKQSRLRSRESSEAETVEMIAAEISEFTGVNGTRPELVLTGVQESVSSSATSIEGNTKLLTDCENSSQTSSCVNTHGETIPSSLANEEMIIPVTEMTHEQVQQQLAAGNIEVQMEGQDGSAPTAICVMEMSEDPTPESTLVTVQKMEDDNNAVYVQVVEVGKDGDIDETSNIPKVLTVSDDGTVEMVEVMWDDMVGTEVDSGQSLQF